MTINPQESRPTPHPSQPKPGLARILVTDDQPEMLRLVDRALGDRYRCEFAATVSQAHEKLDSTTFQLALCDLQMRGGSGLALAEEITEEHPETAVVLVTETDDPEVAQRAFGFGGHGVHGYLVKPFWPGQLLITAMNALRRRELEIIEREYRLNNEQRRQTIIDMAPMPIYVKDSEYRYIFANSEAEAMAGQERGHILGRTDEAIMEPEGLAHTRAIDRQILEQGTRFEAEETLEIAGIERTFQTVKFPLLDERGKATAVCGISTDITAQKEALRLRDELAAAQREAIDELQLSRQETVERLAKAVEAHDLTTGEHVERMARVAAFLGTLLGLDAERVQLLRLAAPMHDVGKIATPGELLRKPGSLTSEERIEVNRHTTVGHEILADSKSEVLRLAASIALTHHERFDGNGYPRGLGGNEIPLEGRITAVADVFDALLSDRPYRPAFTVGETVETIRESSGSHFDPQIVELLLDHLDEALSLRESVPAHL
ncbi:MAG TPA: HD domain-containing phosphohydrolase [Solirubrobacterales bacterium]|nr:HD domain-containing phosphohydrolase [Solirubrobacterales bacterium]